MAAAIEEDLMDLAHRLAAESRTPHPLSDCAGRVSVESGFAPIPALKAGRVKPMVAVKELHKGQVGV
jgi:hypothetical protein